MFSEDELVAKGYQLTELRVGKSIMALSETVKESLRDAQEDLRNALACAAKNRKTICK